MDPSTFTGSLACATWDGLTLQMSDDWSIEDGREFFDIKSHLQDYLSSGLKDLVVKIKCKPIAFSGSIETMFAKLFPYTGFKKGQLVFDDTAKPMVIQTTDDKAITLANVRVLESPGINFDPDKDFFDDITFVALLAPDAELGDVDSFLSIADSTYAEPALTPANILHDVFALAWGNVAPFDAIEVGEGGIKFVPKWNLQPRKRKTLTYNYQVTEPTAEVSFMPENIGLDDFFTSIAPFDGATIRLGKEQSGNANKLTLTGSASGMPLLTVPSAFALNPGSVKFGGNIPAEDTITMRAIRKPSSTISSATTNGDPSVTIATGTAGLVVGMAVTGTGIAGGTKIASIDDATHVTLTANATATGTANLTYTGLHSLFTLGVVA